MTEPEIARRCLQCGAAVRARSEVCSQCGQRMRSAASSVEENARVVGGGRKRKAEERVARVRERSLVVLDEAADDPSLRFVLVAFLLFAVFVVLLLLSLVLS